ncbi:MAG: phage protein NinX family protein [Aeromonadaceae bacterium]
MNYEEMSDFDINQAVTCELFGCHEWSVNQEGTFYHCGSDGSGYFIQTVADYCNNPSDAWPIIIESKINILHYKIGMIGARCGAYIAVDENALRAAMIVFLMMNEK